MHDELAARGHTVVAGSAKLAEMLGKTLNGLVRIASELCSLNPSAGQACEATTLRKAMTREMSQNDSVAHAMIETIHETAHESIVEISEDIIPILAEEARALRLNVNPQRAIARFRIVADFQAGYDHLWHQDSIDPPSVARNERALKIGFWIPLHDVGTDEGAIEFSSGSHFHPIPHTDKDSRGRLCFPTDRLRAYEKHRVAVSFGNLLAIDPWVAHRTAPNLSPLARIALLVWF